MTKGNTNLVINGKGFGTDKTNVIVTIDGLLNFIYIYLCIFLFTIFN